MAKKYKFLFINIGGDFLSIAQRIQDEGYETFSWYSKDANKGSGETGKGIIYLVDDKFDVIKQFQDKKDELIILIDDNSEGDLCDYLRHEGWMVIGSSHFGDTAEHERDLGNELAKKVGIPLPPTKVFSDFQSAKEFLNSFQGKFSDARFVFKGNGADLAGGSKTYVGKDIADTMWFLDWVERDQEIHGYHVETFELQLVIDGIEADFASWFDGEKFTGTAILDMEEKKMAGLGAAEGCLGQVITFLDASKSKYYKEYLSKLTPILSKVGDITEWAANNIIAEKDHKPYFLEWTPRFGWDAAFGELAILQDSGKSIAEFFIRIATKTGFPKGFFPYGKYSAAVRFYSESTGANSKDVKGKPIYWDKKIEKNLWFYSIRKREGDTYEITGNPIGVAVAVADTPEEAIAKVYEIVSPKNNFLTTPDIWYSEHIGERALTEIPKLKAWGWLD
jgi:phosphoribosylamine-glycine ligase